MQTVGQWTEELVVCGPQTLEENVIKYCNTPFKLNALVEKFI